MIASIIPEQLLLSRESVKLGRFVVNIEQPYEGYYDPLETEPPALLTVREAVSHDYLDVGTSGFGVKLTALISTLFSRQAKTKVCVAAERVTTYTLDNSDDWFYKATSLPAMQEWIERVVDSGRGVYMIVGFHTITDAKLSLQSEVGSNASGQFHAPVALAVGGLGATVPFGNLIDPSIGMQKQAVSGEQSLYSAAGEHVCAIQYRRLRHRWLSRKLADRPRISKVRHWQSTETSRDENDSDDDILEVEVEDPEELEEGWHKTTVGEDESVFSRLPVGY